MKDQHHPPHHRSRAPTPTPVAPMERDSERHHRTRLDLDLERDSQPKPDPLEQPVTGSGSTRRGPPTAHPNKTPHTAQRPNPSPHQTRRAQRSLDWGQNRGVHRPSSPPARSSVPARLPPAAGSGVRSDRGGASPEPRQAARPLDDAPGGGLANLARGGVGERGRDTPSPFAPVRGTPRVHARVRARALAGRDNFGTRNGEGRW